MRRSDVLAILSLLGVLATASLTAPRWSRYLREQPDAPAPIARARTPQQGPATKLAEKKISVKLYFEDEEQPALVQEEREIPFAPDLPTQLRFVVEELLKGPTTGRAGAFPPDTKVLGVFVTAAGTAHVDFSKEALAAPIPGSTSERLAVYSLVDTITANFPAVKRVQLLVEDKPVETLSGHVDLSRPLVPDMTLVAQKAPPLPVAGPPSEGAPAPAEPQPSPSPSASPARKPLAGVPNR